MFIIVRWCEIWIYGYLYISVCTSEGDLGYVLGKAEGEGKLWHGHVSAVTVAPSYRRLGLAKTLMDDFEDLCVNTYRNYFVDLFVRETNLLAQEMYEKFGYCTCKFETFLSMCHVICCKRFWEWEI